VALVPARVLEEFFADPTRFGVVMIIAAGFVALLVAAAFAIRVCDRVFFKVIV